MDSRIYQLYKPLRNHLNAISVENALYVIWAYINYFQFDNKPPKDIEVHRNVLNAKDMPSRAVYEWELSLLAREVISNSQLDTALATKDFRKWSYFANAINKIKEFENNAWPAIGDTSLLRHELRRIAHRQFHWQFKVSSSDFVRYYKIYSNERLNHIVERTINLSTQSWYTIGTAILGAFLSYTRVNVDPNIEISGITKKDFDTFLSFTSADIDHLRNIVARDVKYDDEYVYTFNPLEYYPIIEMGKFYYCPIINFLAWRITSGLFFDLVKESEFGQHFGLAFQDYLTEVSDKVLEKNKTSVFPEAKYNVGKREKDGVDIILSQDDSLLFVEAKAKRMQVKSKTQLSSDTAINRDLDILADDIVQVYLTMNDYLEGYYKQIDFDSEKRVYPLIVTLEDWFLIGEDANDLKQRVLQKLRENDLSEDLYKNSPYLLCSAKTYELLVQVMNNVSLITVLDEWFKPEKEGHDFGNFLLTKYGGNYPEIDDLFPGDFERIYPDQTR